MSDLRIANQSPVFRANAPAFSPLDPGRGNPILQSLQTPGYGSPGQLFSCPAPGSDLANSLSLTNLQSQVAEQVIGKPVSAANPNIERAGDTGMAAGTVADAAAGTAKAVGTAGNLAKIGKVAKIAGPAGTVVATGAQLVETGLEIRDARRDPNLSQAEKEQKAGKAAVVGGAKLLGGTGGLVGGMALGFMVGGPIGMVVGGVAGGFGGDWVGGKAGEALGDTVVGRTVGKLFS